MLSPVFLCLDYNELCNVFVCIAMHFLAIFIVYKFFLLLLHLTCIEFL